MNGETNLAKLLKSLSPRLSDDDYVFCSFADSAYGDHAGLQPIAAISESEGLTLIVPRAKADAAGLEYESVFSKISLSVHSSLDAVGLSAAIAAKLSERGISTNLVAGYYHDHIFVQRRHASSALEALAELAR